MRPSWKQFAIGVAIGIAALLIWFRLGTSGTFPFLLLLLSGSVVGHSPFILNTGEYDPAYVRDDVPWARVGARRWLVQMIVTVTVSIALLLAGGWLWDRVKLRAPSLTPAVMRGVVLPLILSVLWLVVVIASFRKLRATHAHPLRRVQGERYSRGAP